MGLQGPEGAKGWWACLGLGFVCAAGLAAWAAWPGPSRAAAHPEMAQAAPSAVLARIRARGEVAVGVRTDFPPFGMEDARGRLRGLEVDLAQALADHLGVALRPVPVTLEDRFDRLRDGTVDVLIAAVGDTPARRRETTAVEPHYYGSGVNVLLRPGQAATDWPQLRGRAVCAVEGASFNAWLAQRHHAALHVAPSVAEALRALDQGRCAGLLYTEAAVQHLRRLPPWRHYRTPLEPALVVPWAVRLARAEQGGELEREVGNALARWHRDGTLVALERKWGLEPSRFLQQARALWSARRADGALVCARDARGQWPSACRDAAFVEPPQAQGVLRAAMWLRDRWGVRLAPAGEDFDGARYLRSLALTVLLAGAVLAGAWVAVTSLAMRRLAAGAAKAAQRIRWPPVRPRAREAPLSPPAWALLAA